MGRVESCMQIKRETAHNNITLKMKWQQQVLRPQSLSFSIIFVRFLFLVLFMNNRFELQAIVAYGQEKRLIWKIVPAINQVVGGRTVHTLQEETEATIFKFLILGRLCQFGGNCVGLKKIDHFNAVAHHIVNSKS